MADVDIKFEREGLEGIVAVGSYLSDSAGRFGIRFIDICDMDADIHFCEVEIVNGGELLSEETEAERSYFEKMDDSDRKRLACQARLEHSGELVVMTKESVREDKGSEKEASQESYRKEFEAMPLEGKIAELMQLEAIALSETLSFVINSPFKVAGKVLDVLAEFGFKLEDAQKEAVRPKEHRTDSESDAESDNGASATEAGETADDNDVE